MNEAVDYGFNGAPDNYADESHYAAAPASKRRRLNEPWQDDAETSNSKLNDQLHSFAQENHANGGLYDAAGGDQAAVLSESMPSAPPTSMADSAGQPTAWASPYPDVSAYQQPYYYQQTDPSAYNSPWPPHDEAQPGETSSIRPPLSPPNTVPYVSTTTPTEHSIMAFNDAVPVSSYQNLDIATHQPLPSIPSHAQSANQSGSPYLEDASVHLKTQSLSILENLATQLVHTIAKASYPQLQDFIQGSETEEGQAFSTLKNLFDQTRKVYSRDTPFIDALAIQMFQPHQQEVIRKANIATFVSSILGAHDVSFFHLNEYFMETFVPLGHRLLKWQGVIFLELKTQTYVSALMNSDGSPEAMLDELFPPDMDAQILTRHPDAPSLSPSEQDFIDRSRARKAYLLAEPTTEEGSKELPKKYQWTDFVREFATSIAKNADSLLNTPARGSLLLGGANGNDRKSASAQQNSQESGRSRIASPINSSEDPSNGNVTGTATSEAPRKTTGVSTTVRQPWTKTEEDALLSGLEKVGGPHWSQILALYGRGGSISETLKDRNQVQLKDKARNLKLWYLKVDREVPAALQNVTGELRKRGGARARAALSTADQLDQQLSTGPMTNSAQNGGAKNIDPSLDTGNPAKRSKK